MITILAIILWICGYGHIAAMGLLAGLITNFLWCIFVIAVKAFPSNWAEQSLYMKKILDGTATAGDYVNQFLGYFIAMCIGTMIAIQKIPVLYLLLIAVVWLILCAL